MVEVETISTTRRQISILLLMIDSPVGLKTVTIATLSQFPLLAGSHHRQERAVLLEVLHHPLQDTDLMVEASHKLRIFSPLVTGMGMARLDTLMIVVEVIVGVEIRTEDNIEGAVKQWASHTIEFGLIDNSETLIITVLAKLNLIARKERQLSTVEHV
jgi:hypothetical protein